MRVHPTIIGRDVIACRHSNTTVLLVRRVASLALGVARCVDDQACRYDSRICWCGERREESRKHKESRLPLLEGYIFTPETLFNVLTFKRNNPPYHYNHPLFPSHQHQNMHAPTFLLAALAAVAFALPSTLVERQTAMQCSPGMECCLTCRDDECCWNGDDGALRQCVEQDGKQM